ncbi:heme peroxidase [Aspergillus foveolatus]|uniref:heme peroxidase n=1 Tax=Aspergillus foveolatus TaxID=210207 RepID=UPI003CCDEE8E
MIYRWHATTSNEDEKWLNELSGRVFGSKVDPSTLSAQRYLNGLHEYLGKTAPGEPNTWMFGGLNRGKDGMFVDKDLVNLLHDGCETSPVRAFGARNIPKAMKAIEMRGIEKGREWGLATLNELRAFFKLKPHSTFTDVNSDSKVAEALEALYGHLDNIELYAGVQAEEAKKPFLPGAGFCSGFTISFAILLDAVALVRGDRFYTVDYSPVNLTNFGRVGPRRRKWRRHVQAPHACFSWLKCLKKADTLEFKRPEYTRSPVAITSWKGVVELLNNPEVFRVPWNKNTFRLTKHDYMLSGDLAANLEQRTFMAERLYRVPDALEQVRKFYESITANLIRRNSMQLGNCPVYTFASAGRVLRKPSQTKNGDGKDGKKDRALGYVEHYANTEGLVSKLGVLQFTSRSSTSSASSHTNTNYIHNQHSHQNPPFNHFHGPVFIRESSGHLLNMHYLDTMFSEDSGFMDRLVDLPMDGGIVQRPLGDLSRLWKYRGGGSPDDGEYCHGDGDKDKVDVKGLEG